MLDRRPRRFGPLRAVIRIFPGDALAPSANTIGINTYQEDATAVNASKARFKKMHERHVNFTKSDGFYFHDLVVDEPRLTVKGNQYKSTQVAGASKNATRPEQLRRRKPN